jgi:hypothetical protein
MGRFDAAWIVGFACIFTTAMYVRSLNMDGSTPLVFSALLFGAYCAWVFAPFLRKPPGRRKLAYQILVGAVVGGSIGTLLAGNAQAAVLGFVLGGAAGFVADLWVPYVQLP